MNPFGKMREEMDRAWKDFFEKNPSKRETDIFRQVEERMKEVSTRSFRSRKPNYRRGKARRGSLQKELF